MSTEFNPHWPAEDPDGHQAHELRRMFPMPKGPLQDEATRDVLDLMSGDDDEPDAYDPLMGMPHPLDFDAD